jgi:hypothetical protein
LIITGIARAAFRSARTGGITSGSDRVSRDHIECAAEDEGKMKEIDKVAR